MVTIEEIRERLAAHREWLLVRGSQRSTAILASEVEFSEGRNGSQVGLLDDSGFKVWRLNDVALNQGEIVLETAGPFGLGAETLTFIPRTPASELAAEVARARLDKANEIAELLKATTPAIKLRRVALNVENGRLAQIEFLDGGRCRAAVADITGTVPLEAILAASIAWLDKAAHRKQHPVKDLLIICEKRPARSMQKLVTLLAGFWKDKIVVAEIDRRSEPLRISALRPKVLRDLWSEKAPKLVVPTSQNLSQTAYEIAELDPKAIDVIYSRQGETLRFNGLPFARVRSIMGTEKVWVGTGRDRRLLVGDDRKDLQRLIEQLREQRSAGTDNKRHTLYRASPEAWLESILRKNITLLDPNLILSPIYNQFRSSNDKIDLLALRRDGRLVIIELKTQPDRAGVFQAAEYWRKIELQRRRGILRAANLFEGREITDRAALVYIVAPAWSFFRDFEFFARALNPEIELWRFELHENWRERVRVVDRVNYDGRTYL